MAYRTASYAEAKGLVAEHVASDRAASTYVGSTAKSQAFFRKMGESHQEAERLRLQCRSAANASAARNHEEKVDMVYISSTIDHARAVSSYAKDTVTDDVAHRLERFNKAGAPLWLGHLAEPKHWEQNVVTPRAGTGQTPTLADASPPKSARMLPGAMEPYQARDAYSQQISDVLAATAAPIAAKPQSTHQTDAKKPGTADPLAPLQSASLAPAAAVVSDTTSIDLQAFESAIPNQKRKDDDDDSLDDGLIDDENESESDLDDESEQSDSWPPSAPLARFKMRCQFSKRFQGQSAEEKAMFEEMNKDISDKIKDTKFVKLDAPVVGWLNQKFCMSVDNEQTFSIGFPIILLTMLDAIYSKRVRWREVDWRLQYKRALQKNYSEVGVVWSEVNMEKAKEFRVENTQVRLEKLPTSDVPEKLEFLRLMKKWYDQRIHHAGPYDPMAMRRLLVEQCTLWGHAVKFPPWIHYDKEYKVDVNEQDALELKKTEEFNKMPEFQRLIHFLGCQEYQSM